MSKDFDTTFSDALDLASHAVHTVGPAAARIRGRKRAMRKRIVLSATSLALVAVATTAAFAVAGKNSGTPNSTTGSPHVTVSSSPTGAPSTSTSPTPSSSASSSSTPSSPANSNPTGSGSPASGQPTAADPHQVVDAAWLTADQMPFASTLHWKILPATGIPLTATVFYYPKTTGLQGLTVCGDPSKLLSRTIGAQGDEYSAQPKVSSNSASQFVFFFADAASAQQTFAWIQGLYSPTCVSGTSVMTTRTAGDGQTSATWLSRKGSTGPVDLAPYNREYFVLRGSTIGYVWMNSTRNLPATYDDSTVLSTIASHLCVYGGPCS